MLGVDIPDLVWYINTMTTIMLGTKIYYTGDMANASGWFEVVWVGPSWFSLKELPGGDDRLFKGVLNAQIGHVYQGHCNPRFVTEHAHIAWRQSKISR